MALFDVRIGRNLSFKLFALLRPGHARDSIFFPGEIDSYARNDQWNVVGNQNQSVP